MTSPIPSGPAGDRFWDIIETSRSGPDTSETGQAQALRQALDGLSETELTAFAQSYYEALRTSYRWDLWAAAYILNGGCSDDGFDYFRDWLISRGRSTFESALNDPETLADVADPDAMEFEEFRYVMHEAAEQNFNSSLTISVEQQIEPAGEPFDEDGVYGLYPGLTEIYKRHMLGEPAPEPAPEPARPVLKKKQKRRWWHIFGFGRR